MATPRDEDAVLCLQEQFVDEMSDPMGIDDDFERGEFVLLEAVQGDERRVVGMMSLTRASASPFVVERVFPDMWQRLDLRALTGKTDLRRSDVVEIDWGYLAKPYRGRGLAKLLLAGCVLHAHHRGYAACVGMVAGGALEMMPDGFFHGSGFTTSQGGVRYELGAFVPAQIAEKVENLVDEACQHQRSIVWELQRLDDPSASVAKGRSPSIAPSTGIVA
ncbi:hypothetical protein [Polyangium sorediatum]|uniref:N-acetyltransferase domain-containing protein n=1 Tax=Polyangium sorediatum TaxID=889274 RepID=A0ABT6P9Z5_9BACT|nr:hypothetical protein [Polyangium sorediatum]MDI1437457.1 hypothetical protein [Polyangium sorediatum]